ncbi:hypothetical protein CYLTODRAFT_493633 [Cylindrobasidium torrendii FP15055 ss-10]|uniref:DUF1793-domain-containing protein n=1 Tax=Cylindrobasidium torrendii FP15055 ss-10 TaxID=1314674 RepID=A0A0D7AZZ4_9AGAR|nr:hypothetical protein CYLTODRAFT_493633 [Cylindrobasidium torrendii FP15055 ss-10]
MLWLVLCFLFSVVVAQKWPTSIPIAVRAPHFNSYIVLGSNQNQTQKPSHWNLKHDVGWTLWMSVDGEKPTKLFGGIFRQGETPEATFKDVELTPTRSILTVDVGPVEATVTFLNPIEPEDLVLQSFPFTYMYCNVSTTDGREHSVRLFTDVTGEWLAKDLKKTVKWNFTESDSMFFHTAWLDSPTRLSYDYAGMAEDSFLWFASTKSDTTTYRAGSAVMCLKRFTENGTLDGARDTDYRGINERDTPAFAFARDLGNISSTSDTAVWALGLTRDPSVSFQASQRRPYYTSKYTSVPQAMTAFLSGFEDAKKRAIDLDNSLMNAARSISSEYADLVAIGTRMALSAIDFTTAAGEHENDTMAFMAIPYDSESRVSAVDTIFASFPALLRLNATWAGYLLRPLLDVGTTSWPDIEYASYDLGQKYPTISVQEPPQKNSIESTGDMLIMVWAQARVSGDATRLTSHYHLLKKWADYLVNKGVDLTAGLSDGAGIRNANLALKGVLGVKCMSLIAKAVSLEDDHRKYSDSAHSMYKAWKAKAFRENHIVSDYTNQSSWGLIYSIFYDKMLRLDVVDEEVLNAQDAFYKSQIVDNAAVAKFGVTFDTMDSHVSAPWNMITAGATNNTEVRDRLISQVRAKMYANGTSKGIFPALYDSSSSSSRDTSYGSPAQGAMLSLLAMDLHLQTPKGTSPNLTQDPSTSSDLSGGEKKHVLVGPILGGVIGGLAILIIFLILLFCYRRRQRKDPRLLAHYSPFMVPPPTSVAGISEHERGNTSSTVSLLPLKLKQDMAPRPSPPASPQTIWRKPRIPEPEEPAASASQANGPGLHGELENLRREMDRLRMEGLMLPPLYERR